jgi:hypothetical protein
MYPHALARPIAQEQESSSVAIQPAAPVEAAAANGNAPGSAEVATACNGVAADTQRHSEAVRRNGAVVSALDTATGAQNGVGAGQGDKQGGQGAKQPAGNNTAATAAGNKQTDVTAHQQQQKETAGARDAAAVGADGALLPPVLINDASYATRVQAAIINCWLLMAALKGCTAHSYLDTQHMQLWHVALTSYAHVEYGWLCSFA